MGPPTTFGLLHTTGRVLGFVGARLVSAATVVSLEGWQVAHDVRARIFRHT